MDGKKPESSASSLSSQLFGAVESPSSSAGHFASIFPSPSKVLPGRDSSSSDVLGSWQKQNQKWNSNQGIRGMKKYEERSTDNQDRTPNFLERRTEPCNLSSSLHYGGQEMYSQSASAQNSGLYSVFNKSTGEDDPDGDHSQSVSRGNWWQGSLYY